MFRRLGIGIGTACLVGAIAIGAVVSPDPEEQRGQVGTCLQRAGLTVSDSDLTGGFDETVPGLDVDAGSEEQHLAYVWLFHNGTDADEAQDDLADEGRLEVIENALLATEGEPAPQVEQVRRCVRETVDA